jgi:hypothetical protein
MAAAGFTHSQLAAKLVEGCVAHIAGNVQGKMPVTPVPISELERADAGLKQGGQTLLYPVNKDGGVFLDLQGSTATIWYITGDFDRGLAALEGALKASGHSVKQLKDEAQSAPRQRTRSYEVELGGGRMAHVIAEYAERGAQPERFLVRVVAQVRKK